MKRRVFIGLLFSTSVIFFAGSFQFLNTKKRFHILLKNLWPWLDIDQESLKQFTNDYYKYKCNTLSCQIKLSVVMMLESSGIFHNILKWNRKVWKEKLSNQFLLSTDFFQNGMDEGRTIKYVLYYNPYINPCYSPKP